MEKMIDNPDEIDEYHCNKQVQHKGQPESSDPVNPLAKCGSCCTFKYIAHNKHRNDSPEYNDIPPLHRLAQRKNLKPTDKQIIVNRRVYNQDNAKKNQEGDAAHVL